MVAKAFNFNFELQIRSYITSSPAASVLIRAFRHYRFCEEATVGVEPHCTEVAGITLKAAQLGARASKSA
jgi:hypothetical protein